MSDIDEHYSEECVETGKRLGKLPAKHDMRQLMFAKYAVDARPVPKESDFWRKRAKFPAKTFGNRENGSCTRASQAILAMRMERIETRQTPKITEKEVLRVYYEMTEELYGGGDTGAYETDALNAWRRPDKTFRDHKGRPLTIDAYVRVNHMNGDEVRRAIHYSGAKGIKVCFDLPSAWAQIDPPELWAEPADGRYVGPYIPGSWGGHSMTADAYSESGIRLIHTWYETAPFVQTITWRAFFAYCSECYLVIDSIDAWRKRLGAEKMEQLIADVNAVSQHPIASTEV